jgi:outer membrane receptor for monomeric catechols
MWSAETVSDPTLDVPAAAVARSIVYGNRLPYAPEYRFNIFNRYTFTENFAGEYGRGLTLGLGMRYSSEIIISNDQNFNASRGGLTAGDYVVWQGLVSYPFEVFGYKMSGTLNVDNVLDEEYSEGNFSLAPPRSYMFTLGLRF